MNLEEMKGLSSDAQRELFKRLSKVRDMAKTTNYSALYGVGAKKLARELGISVTEASNLLEAYWEVNWSVKKRASEQFVKTLKDGSMWLKNPVSGFFYSLRFEKDIWSTLNQGLGVYCFDTWVAYTIAQGCEVVLQMHDEILVECDVEDKEATAEKLHKAMEKTNEKVKLNVTLSVDVQYGGNYADVH